MSNNQVAAQSNSLQHHRPTISRTSTDGSSNNDLQHSIKRNIGSSTTSLTAFTISHHDSVLLLLPVSLSPFEYASPLASHSNLHSLNHLQKGHNVNGSLINMDSEDLDFDTAYDLINESIDHYNNKSSIGQMHSQQPRTPDQIHSHIYHHQQQQQQQQHIHHQQQQLKLFHDNDQIYQDHKRAIIQAGQQANHAHQDQGQHPQSSPFSVSPHTRNLLHSVNNMASAYHLNNSGYELLSITESSALEKFLDSVVDDSRLTDLGRHWPSIDPLAKADTDYVLPTLVTEGNNKRRMSHIPDLKLQKLDQNMRAIHPIPANHVLPLSYLLSPSDSTGPTFDSSSTTPTPPLQSSFESVEEEKDKPAKKKRGRKKKTSSEFEVTVKKPKQESSTPETDFSKIRRLMLTEEQKKQNHTESEKKRRATIKASYDKLLDTIKFENCYHIKYATNDDGSNKKTKRANSRYAVMSCVISEIEWLVKSNEELKQRLQQQLN